MISDKEIHTMLSLIVMGDIKLIPEAKIAAVIQEFKDLRAKLEAAETRLESFRLNARSLEKCIDDQRDMIISVQQERDNLQKLALPLYQEMRRETYYNLSSYERRAYAIVQAIVGEAKP